MTYMVVRHKVEEYAAWKSVFDEHAATRKAMGGKGYLLLRNADNTNELLILLELDDLNKAREFAGSQDLRETMARAGVADEPDIYFCETLEHKPS